MFFFAGYVSQNNTTFIHFFPSFLPLGATAQGELWPPE
jgi:hypothetical protein